MLVKKDKEEIVDEVWTLDRIKSFLDLTPPIGINADFHALYSAYKNMRLEDFEKFLSFFSAAKRNLHATNQDNEPLLSIINKHRRGTNYAKSLAKVQKQKSA